MPRGPFGGPRPFASDRKTVLVLVGIDGQTPPSDILLSTEQAVSDNLHNKLRIPHDSLSVAVTIEDMPTTQQIEELGQRVQHVQQFDIESPWREISQDHINGIHNDVISTLKGLGYNVEGTKTTVV